VAGEVRERMAALGVRSLAEVVGSVERLRPRNESASHSVATLLQPSSEAAHQSAKDLPLEIHLPETAKDIRRKLLRGVDGLKAFPFVHHSLSISNSDRSVGAHLSGHILRRTNFDGLAAGKSIRCEFRGSAGQSFGAFLVPGIRFRLVGDANDYVGKGLSGGTIAITAGAAASKRGDVLAGNTVLYGATSGKLFIAGRVGERFAVRNSGALAIIEGAGQHGCEYMTAGIAVILGPAGMNLGSGMTGGLTYILRDALTGDNCNHEFVRCAEIGDGAGEQEEGWLRTLLQEHFRLTGSQRARRLLQSTHLLPLVRLEPVHLPCSIADTWAPFLTRPVIRDDAEVPDVVRALPLENENMRETSDSAC
jgi:glutamate synthase (NADPH/NADH) large chain